MSLRTYTLVTAALAIVVAIAWSNMNDVSGIASDPAAPAPNAPAGANSISASDANMSLAEYARLCVEKIAEIPPLDSRQGVIIPITVNGKVPDKYKPNMPCDCPSLLPKLGCAGQCVPYSRIQLLRDDNQAQMVALFRRKVIRDKDSPLFDEVDLIVHSVITGDTGWFQATAQNPDCDPAIGLDGTNVPVPQAAGADAFWNTPQQVVEAKCGECHDNDPFYYSPYIAQVINHVPADPLGKYSNAIGPFKAWPKLESIDSRGNTCTGCHRIGTHYTSGEGLQSAIGALPTPQADAQAQQYPQSHWMPAHNFLTEAAWNVVYAESAQKLLDWHNHPLEHSDVTVTPIPSGAPR